MERCVLGLAESGGQYTHWVRSTEKIGRSNNHGAKHQLDWQHAANTLLRGSIFADVRSHHLPVVKSIAFFVIHLTSSLLDFAHRACRCSRVSVFTYVAFICKIIMQTLSGMVLLSFLVAAVTINGQAVGFAEGQANHLVKSSRAKKPGNLAHSQQLQVREDRTIFSG